MKNFQDFKLEEADLIFGGEFEPTTWWANDGSGDHGTDIYDTDTGRYVFLGV